MTLSALVRTDTTWSQQDAQTATAMLLSVTGLWVLSSLDRPTSRIKIAILLTMVFAAVLMFYLPLTTEFFGFSYLSGPKLVLVFVIGLLSSLAIELASYLLKSRSKNEIRL